MTLKRWAVLCALLFLAPLAGCLDTGPAPGSASDPEKSAELLEAPEWTEGERWSYLTTDAQGAPMYDETYRVLGIGEVEGTPVYRVVWTGTPADPGEPPQERTRYFAIGTLDEVGGCGEDDPQQLCGKHVPLFGFPLEDGKTWQWTPPAPPPGHGDYDVQAEAHAPADGGSLWRIAHETSEDAPDGPLRVKISYDPDVNFMRTFTIEHAESGETRQHTELQEHHRP